MRTPRPIRALVVLPLLVATAACEEDLARPGGADVAEVAVDPPEVSLAIGDRLQLREIVRNAQGFILPEQAVWSSDDPQVVSVDSVGVVEALAVGEARITATVGELSGTSVIEVERPPPPLFAEHTCAAGLDDTLYCWGRGDAGALGNGQTFDREYPTRVTGGVGVKAVSTGGAHTCSVDADGRGWCWGRGEEGQLGTDGSATRLEPAAVSGTRLWSRIDAGGRHSCGLAEGGAVLCWGWNVSGQVGNGTTVGLDVPTALAGGPAEWADVSAGGRHSCAVSRDDEVWCWGENDRGQLGIGSTAVALEPTRVASELSFVRVSAGAEHTCALTRSGEIWCWGANDRGQLGDATLDDRTTPVPLTGPPVEYVDLAVGGAHACAVTEDSEVHCWGDGAVGQIGDGANRLRGNATPVPVPQAAVRVVVGAEHSCSIVPGGWLWCWGSDRYGQLGAEGGRASTPRPVLRPGGDSAALVEITPSDASLLFGKAMELEARVRNAAGFVIGNGVEWSSANPDVARIDGGGRVVSFGYGTAHIEARVFGLQASAELRVRAADLPQISRHGCARRANGEVWCWGRGINGQLGRGGRVEAGGDPAPVPNLGGAVSVTTGLAHACALTETGEAWCWGHGMEGQLGVGERTEGFGVRVVDAEVAFVQLDAGGLHGCAIAVGGTLRCWGRNEEGQVGDGSGEDALRPVELAGRWSSVTAGRLHSCALDESGAAWCWGSNAYGQLGDGTTTDRDEPVRVAGGRSFASIEAGDGHTCALEPTGLAWCWGRNDGAQLGTGSIEDALTPQPVSLGVRYSAITAGRLHSCAIANGGGVWCWGDGRRGQVGDGSAKLLGNPTPVPLPLPAFALVARGDRSCALLTDLLLRCWGANEEGELGLEDGPVLAPRRVGDDLWVGVG